MAALLRKLDIPFARVETLMSYDGHVIFENGDTMAAARDKLAEIHIDGAPLFFLEPHPEQPKLFYRIDFSMPVESQARIATGTQSLQFDEEIIKIVVRTGKHNQKGVIFHNCADLDLAGKSVIFNHDLFKIIYPDLFADNPISQTAAG